MAKADIRNCRVPNGLLRAHLRNSNYNPTAPQPFPPRPHSPRPLSPRPPKGEIHFSPPRRPMARPRFRFGLVRAPHGPPTSGGYRGALVRLQARDGSRTSDKLPSLAITAAQAGLAFCSEPSRAKRVPSRASASITGCVRKTLLRLRPSAYLTRDHRLALAFASGWLVHRTSHRQAAATGAALSPPRPLSPRPLSNHDKLRARQKCRALLSFPFVRFPTKTAHILRTK